jgi:hypothetical protein
MLDDMEKMIKERLLNELIDKMSDAGGERMKPKGLGVSVEAPDKAHLEEGLDHAKDILSNSKESPMPEPNEGDDEQRLMALLGDDDDEDEDKY